MTHVAPNPTTFPPTAPQNIFACNVNETLLMRTMDLFVSTGLRDAGYE